MPYIVEDAIDSARVPPGDGPILIVIHGTGASSDGALKTDTGTHWWQPGSEFDRWLCARIQRRTGARLDSNDVLRFVWSGENSEYSREIAAGALLALIRPLEAAGRPISIVAHDHGGNVARRACEMATIAGSSAPPWSVVCIGTPFFHYGLAPRLRTIAVRLAFFPVWVACLWLAPQWLAVHFLQVTNVWYAVIIGLFALNSLFQILSAVRELDMRRYRARSRFADRAVFTNLCSRHDEALALLKSLNSHVRLMRQRESKVWLLTPLGGVFVVVFAMYALGTVMTLFASIAGATPFVTVFQMSEALFLLLAVAGAMSVFYPLADFLFDLAGTLRLRSLAYGNDRDAAITGVEPFPWRDTEASAVLLPPRVEKAVEAFIVERADAHARKPRAAMRPDTQLFVQDAQTKVDRTLTGDALVHTAYFCVEPFADLVAASLERSGQWKRAPSSTA